VEKPSCMILFLMTQIMMVLLFWLFKQPNQMLFPIHLPLSFLQAPTIGQCCVSWSSYTYPWGCLWLSPFRGSYYRRLLRRWSFGWSAPGRGTVGFLFLWWWLWSQITPFASSFYWSRASFSPTRRSSTYYNCNSKYLSFLYFTQ